jgi:uncharacterized protein (DUF1697 family)
MAKLIAFLRAINVGGHTVKMDALQGLFAQLGLESVTTFIASGNVIFETPREDEQELEGKIERHLEDALGYGVATFLRSSAELRAAALRQPFPALQTERMSVYCGFLKNEPSSEGVQRLMALRSAVDEFEVHGREVYWLCRIRSSDSTFSGAVLEKTLRMPATLRNMTTVRKIAELVAGG